MNRAVAVPGQKARATQRTPSSYCSVGSISTSQRATARWQVVLLAQLLAMCLARHRRQLRHLDYAVSMCCAALHGLATTLLSAGLGTVQVCRLDQRQPAYRVHRSPHLLVAVPALRVRQEAMAPAHA
ncbi:hypothetical protein BCV70DRAFT_80321 [Testicularia cyperi]|uniref:Uncharacterized protein n=1 Tax=Testicularia cyperi TaxID=1882483 RepID=A0A317XFE4_9BASI|nr:hypothetical protein BCV70DRAFT_80321 [Testicularia cyperi]